MHAVQKDDSYICVQIERYVQSVFRNFNKEVNCYSDGKEFLEDLNETGGPDIVFMDIEMPHISGREAAARLREYIWGKDTILVFISSHTDNLIPLFALHPFDFISKPLNDNALHDLMGRILEYIDNNQASIAVKDRRFINNVLISDIVYAEVKEGRKLILHLCDGTEMAEYAKLQDFLNDIKEKSNNFIRIHSSFAVNIRYVKTFSRTEVILLNCLVLPVSESYAKNMNKAYLDVVLRRMK